MKTLLLGVDVGSTVVKAVLFDLQGRVVSSSSRPVPVDRLRPGWVERDAGDTARAALAAIRQTVRGESGRVVAIGVTGCGNGAVFLDRARAPLRAGILSSDTRAAARLAKSVEQREQVAYPGQMPWLLEWFRTHEPGRARRLAHVVFWKDYLRAVLTDQIATDPTDAGAAGLLEFPGRCYRAPDPAWPVLQESLAVAGTVTRAAARATGLRTGTPVFTGCIDCEAAAWGSGVAIPGEFSLVAGTWSINQTFTDRPPRDAGHFLVNPSVDPSRWLVVEGSPTSAANFDWALRLFEPGLDAAAATDEAARAAESRPLFLPRVATGRGAWVGLDASHGRAELLRAVMEGIVFAHRAHVERLSSTLGRPRRTTLVGGVAQNPAWCQLFADALGCVVDVPRGQEHGALGAALCAGVGQGLWPSLRAAQKALVSTGLRYRPRAARFRALSGRYEQISRIEALLYP